MFYCKKNRHRRSLYCLVRYCGVFILKQLAFLCVFGVGLALFGLLMGWQLTLQQWIGLASCATWIALVLLLGVACHIESREQAFTKKECIEIAVMIAALTAFYGIVAALMYCC